MRFIPLLILFSFSLCVYPSQMATDHPLPFISIPGSSVSEMPRIISQDKAKALFPSFEFEWLQHYTTIPTYVGLYPLQISACTLKMKGAERLDNEIVIYYLAKGDCEEVISKVILVQAETLSDTIIAKAINN